MKNFKRLFLSLAVVFALNSIAFADGNAFTPLDFDKPSSSAVSTPNSIDATASDAVGNESIQNAITQIETAQTGIKNDLTNYQAKYADVDAQYKLVKNERAVLKKQVRSIERRLKTLERNKQKLKKTMI